MSFYIWLELDYGESFSFPCFGYLVSECGEYVGFILKENDPDSAFYVSFDSIKHIACLDFTDSFGKLAGLIANYKNVLYLEV